MQESRRLTRAALVAAAHLKQAVSAVQNAPCHIRTNCLARWAEFQLQAAFVTLCDLCQIDPRERFSPAQPSTLYSDDIQFTLDQIRLAVQLMKSVPCRELNPILDNVTDVEAELQIARDSGEFTGKSLRLFISTCNA